MKKGPQLGIDVAQSFANLKVSLPPVQAYLDSGHYLLKYAIILSPIVAMMKRIGTITGRYQTKEFGNRYACLIDLRLESSSSYKLVSRYLQEKQSSSLIIKAVFLRQYQVNL
jgi:hypothetical protein